MEPPQRRAATAGGPGSRAAQQQQRWHVCTFDLAAERAFVVAGQSEAACARTVAENGFAVLGTRAVVLLAPEATHEQALAEVAHLWTELVLETDVRRALQPAFTARTGGDLRAAAAAVCDRCALCHACGWPHHGGQHGSGTVVARWLAPLAEQAPSPSPHKPSPRPTPSQRPSPARRLSLPRRPPPQWSDQQLAIITEVASSSSSAGRCVFVDARAGAAKTSTLVAALQRWQQQQPAAHDAQARVLVFNKHAKVDLQRAIDDAGCEGIRASTCHSAGLSAWRCSRAVLDAGAGGAAQQGALPRPPWARLPPQHKVDAFKLKWVLDNVVLPPEAPGAALRQRASARPQKHPLRKLVHKLVQLARNAAVGVLSDEAGADWDAVWTRHGWELERLAEGAAKAQVAVRGGGQPRSWQEVRLSAMERAKAALAECVRRAYAAPAGATGDDAEHYCIIDFDEQIYMPLWHDARAPGEIWWQPLPLVALDEAQDLNKSRMLLLLKLVLPSGRGRVVAVGDPLQAIYGFTGAMATGMRQLCDRLQAHGYITTQLGLSICWRCPASHLRLVNRLLGVSGQDDGTGRGLLICPAPGAPEGEIVLDAPCFAYAPPPPPPPAGPGQCSEPAAAVVCRTNAPLLALRRALVAEGVTCVFEGCSSVQLHHFLIKALGRTATSSTLTHASVEAALRAAVAATERKAAERAEAGDEAGELRARDRVDGYETLLGLLQHEVPARLRGAALRHALAAAAAAAEKGDAGPPGGGPWLKLSTVHKAKGREWPTVYLLEPEKLRGVLAAAAGRVAQYRAEPGVTDFEQLFVSYVACTRARQRLVLLRTHKGADGRVDAAPLVAGLRSCLGLAPAAEDAPQSQQATQVYSPPEGAQLPAAHAAHAAAEEEEEEEEEEEAAQAQAEEQALAALASDSRYGPRRRLL